MIGQWIWSRADSAVFASAVRLKSDIVPTVWIGSVHGTTAGVTGQLALDPRIAGRRRVGVVIRFEDTFSRAWALGDSALASGVAATVERLLGAAAATGAEIAEVQLDYDCPERLLPRWSGLVAHLSRGVLADRTVWLTSLVSHVRARAYGDLFRDHAAGHILQVFDTGDRMSASYAGQVEHLATRHRMPFRLGVGAFERQFANGRTTDHRAWFDAVPLIAESPFYRGLWVFPAGREWVSLLE